MPPWKFVAGTLVEKSLSHPIYFLCVTFFLTQLMQGSYEAPVLRDNVDSVDSMGEILLSGEMEDDDDVLVGISRDSSDQRPRSVQSGYRTF